MLGRRCLSPFRKRRSLRLGRRDRDHAEPSSRRSRIRAPARCGLQQTRWIGGRVRRIFQRGRLESRAELVGQPNEVSRGNCPKTHRFVVISEWISARSKGTVGANFLPASIRAGRKPTPSPPNASGEKAFQPCRPTRVVRGGISETRPTELQVKAGRWTGSYHVNISSERSSSVSDH